jgi:hypothetical protein
MNINLEMKDVGCIVKAAGRMGLAALVNERVKLFDGSEHVGVNINLPGWRFPVCVVSDGSVAFDNYNGHWGSMSELNKLKAFYGVETAKKAARLKGYVVQEQVKGDKITLTVSVGV